MVFPMIDFFMKETIKLSTENFIVDSFNLFTGKTINVDKTTEIDLEMNRWKSCVFATI